MNHKAAPFAQDAHSMEGLKYKDELWHAYAPLWWIHTVIKYAFYATIILSLWRLIGFFQEQVYLPIAR